jgi:hypothetical protein
LRSVCDALLTPLRMASSTPFVDVPTISVTLYVFSGMVTSTSLVTLCPGNRLWKRRVARKQARHLLK